MTKEKILIIGSGIAGLTLAERFASKNRKVTVIEQRNHIGGNCFDYKNKFGLLVHKYGPHIFHTNNKDVWQYLSRFTGWLDYRHKVLGYIDGKTAPIPFNINSLFIFFAKQEALIIEEKLKKNFGYNQKVPILELLKSDDSVIRKLAKFVYKKVFLEYTMKQWGLKPNQIDPAVTARVPVVISRDDRWFFDKYQGMPKYGYTKMFKKMTKKPNIRIILRQDYLNLKEKIEADRVFYTGAIDRYFNYKYGHLDYRYLRISFSTMKKASYQKSAVVNYPALKFPYTRITEFKKLTGQKSKITTIGKEFSGPSGFMAWPVNNDKNMKILKKYQKEVKKLNGKNIFFVGRLAEFKYYNMDDAVKNSLDLFNSLSK
ncbi:MAG: UDP-galactopyranose mutase [Patescibacteria group bacterium]